MISRSTLVGALLVAELAIVAVAVAVLAPAGATGARDAARLQRSFITGFAPHVVVDARGVDVRIDTHAQPVVEASESVQTSGWVSASVPALTADTIAGGVRISALADTPHAILGSVRHSVHIVVPELASVDVVSAANVDAEGLRAKLSAHTPEGNMRVRDHRGDVDVSSSDGKIELTDVQGDDVAANTHDGRLYLTRVGARRIDAHTNYGRIYAVDVTAQDGALSTHFGRISASFTARSDATLDATTRNDRVTVAGLAAESVDAHAQTIRLGDGRGRFQVSTDDGAVNISEGASS